ncbi:MAG: 30S ribosomal protein S15 [Planctomycetes bacterium]|nr:30S ribosomal protein S15 [Planctomycetota bacterium]
MPTTELRKKRIQEFHINENDTGSADVQVALLTDRIQTLSEHLKSHVKDNHSRRGLLMMVGRRTGLLKYLQRCDLGRYQSVVQRLGLRK